MDFIQEYKKEIQKIEAHNPIGFYPYRIIPKSEIAKLKFAKIIKIEVKEATISLLGRLLGRGESETTIKKYLTEQNLQKSRFYGKAEMIYSNPSLSEKEFIRSNISKRVENEFGLFPEVDFKVEVDEYESYLEKKDLSFDDLVDLREV